MLRQILWTGWILLTISVFNSIYTAWVGLLSFSFFQLALSALQVFLIGIFPVLAIIMADYLWLFRKHVKQAENLNNKLSSQIQQQYNAIIIMGQKKNEFLH